jgi:hypothetical protein
MILEIGVESEVLAATVFLLLREIYKASLEDARIAMTKQQ